jgi:multidrug resistance efflux pump
VLRVEALEEQLVKARKHSAMLQSKLDGAFAQYHNEVQDMQAKSNELVRKNKSLHNKNKGTVLSRRVPIGDVVRWSKPALLIVELETRVEQLKASEVDIERIKMSTRGG